MGLHSVHCTALPVILGRGVFGRGLEKGRAEGWFG